MRSKSKMLGLAALLAVAALLSGASWESKAQAACSTNWVSGIESNPPGTQFRWIYPTSGDVVKQTCTANDTGAWWIYVDWLDYNVYPPVWVAGKIVDQGYGVHLDGYKIDHNPALCGRDMGAAWMRYRIQWDNWTTNNYNNQSVGGISSHILCAP